MASNPSRDIDNFSPRGIPSVFLGYPSTQKGFKLLTLLTRNFFVSKDVTFHEHIFPFKIFPTSLTLLSPSISINPLLLPDNSISSYPSTSLPSSLAPLSPPDCAPRRSSRIIQPPSWHQDYVLAGHGNLPSPTKVNPSTTTHVTIAFLCFMSQSLLNKDHIHFKDDITDAHWIPAIDEELSSLENNLTWHLTTLLNDKKPIGCKWVYKTKYHADGTLDKYKAKLVILENHQKPGEDYEQTFAPGKFIWMSYLLLALICIMLLLLRSF